VSRGLVVGIFAGADPAAIQDALTAQAIDMSKIQVLRSASAAAAAGNGSELDFTDVIVDMESNSLSDDMMKGMGVLDDATGTGVPMGRSAPLTSFSSRETSKNYVSGLAVPEDEAENFNEAIDAGRAVVAYADAGSDADKVAAAFRAAGLLNVRAY
jgi:hypothetical protein